MEQLIIKSKKILKQQILILLAFLLGVLTLKIGDFVGSKVLATTGDWLLLVVLGITLGAGFFVVNAFMIFHGLRSIFESLKLYKLMKDVRNKEGVQFSLKILVLILVLGFVEFVVPVFLFTGAYSS